MDLLQEQKIKKSINYLHACIKKKPVNINNIKLYCNIIEDLTLLQPEDFNVNKKIWTDIQDIFRSFIEENTGKNSEELQNLIRQYENSQKIHHRFKFVSIFIYPYILQI